LESKALHPFLGVSIPISGEYKILYCQFLWAYPFFFNPWIRLLFIKDLIFFRTIKIAGGAVLIFNDSKIFFVASPS